RGVQAADGHAGNGRKPRMAVLVHIDAGGRADGPFRSFVESWTQGLLGPLPFGLQWVAAFVNAQTKKVVVNESRHGANDDVNETEPTVSLGYSHFRAERGVAVHVIGVAGERGIGVMQE